GTEQNVPHPFATMAELLALADRQGCPITDLLWVNECALHGEAASRAFIARIQTVMMDCIDRGLNTPGTLPGGLRVQRRAPVPFTISTQKAHHRASPPTFQVPAPPTAAQPRTNKAGLRQAAARIHAAGWCPQLTARPARSCNHLPPHFSPIGQLV
ncbi:MAG: hypothetical protein Q4A11_06315, partial [Brachymonas sp.]|nr:hypothetical protein [Brachymonas sp.]